MSLLSTAQVELKDYGRYDSILVLHQGDTLANPWAGGLNNPSVSNMDINSDFLQDIVVYDKDHLSFRVFLCMVDSNGVNHWVHSPDYESRFPRMWGWVLAVDYNNDGLKDLFTADVNGDMRLFENVSDGPNPENIAFEQIKFKDPYDTLKRVDYITCKFYTGGGGNYIYTNVYNLGTDIPGITDIDGDGDVDILAFGSRATGVQWYKNLSIEQNGNSDSLLLKLHDLCWGEFEESAGNFELILDTCRGLLPSAPPSGGHSSGGSRHVGSNLLFTHLDCNGQIDVLVGDISFPRMVGGFNTGTPSSPFISTQDTTFPSAGVPIDVYTFPAGYSVNADNDADNDLIVTPNADAYFNNYNQIHLYKNIGTHRCPDFKFIQNNFLVDGMIEVGSNAHPLIVDVDGDSLQDMLVGSFGVWTQSLVHESRLSYYKNVGSRTAPAYELITRDYLPLPQSSDTGLYPTSGDLDGDGDLDLLLGTDRGQLLYYENLASSPQDSMILKHTATGFDAFDFGKSIRPYLFDVNNDGLLDVLMGSQKSTIDLYLNQGTASVPHFDTALVMGDWGGIQHYNILGQGNLSISIIDVDTGGTTLDSITDIGTQRQVFVGSSTGSIYRYTGMDSTGKALLNVMDSVYLYTQNASVSNGDITGDHKPDFMVGQSSGGVNVLLKDGGNIILPPPPKDTTSVTEFNEDNQIHVYPNPTTGLLSISVDFTMDEASVVSVIDMTGRTLKSQELWESEELDISDFPNGLYWIVLNFQGQKFYQQVVKVNP